MSLLLPLEQPSPLIEGQQRQAPKPIIPLKLSELMVATLGGDLLPFTPLPAQMEVLRAIRRQEQEMAEGKRVPGAISLVILKARRMGISTLVQALAFKLITSKPRTRAVVIAHEKEAANYLYGISERFYRELPPEKQPVRRFQNRRGITFDDPLDSSISVDAVGEGAGRGSNIHFCHLSEVAFYGEHGATTLGAVRQCIPALPWCISILESTGYGLGGTFYDEFRRAKRRGEALFFPWWKDPRYRLVPGLPSSDWTTFERKEAEKYRLSPEQVAWMRVKFEKDCGADERIWRQEYPGCEADAFQGKSKAVFDPALVETLYDHCGEAETGKVLLSRGLRGDGSPELTGTVQRLEEPGGPASQYVIGADPALGLETGDYSAAVVLDRVDGRIVAYLNAHLDPDQFAAALVAMARFYNQAWLIVERNNMGHSVISRLRDMRYPKLWSERRPWQKEGQVSPKYGYATTEGSKAAAIESVIHRLRNGQLYCPFREIVEQLVKYQYDGTGRMTAPGSDHDDLCIALALSCRGAEDLGSRDPLDFVRARMASIDVKLGSPSRWTMKDYLAMERMQHPGSDPNAQYVIGGPGDGMGFRP